MGTPGRSRHVVKGWGETVREEVHERKEKQRRRGQGGREYISVIGKVRNNGKLKDDVCIYANMPYSIVYVMLFLCS